jgi:hypothetical protein
VGEISQGAGRRPHTTTTTTWYWLDAARQHALIDSPGFQEFGLRQIEPMHLAGLMPDLRPRWADCRFHNCSHRTSRAAACARPWSAGDQRVRWRIYEASCSRELSQPSAGSRHARAQPSTLASDSSATSSIHSTTERHTRPTTLCRWPGCGGTPAVEPWACGSRRRCRR